MAGRQPTTTSTVDTIPAEMRRTQDSIAHASCTLSMIWRSSACGVAGRGRPPLADETSNAANAAAPSSAASAESAPVASPEAPRESKAAKAQVPTSAHYGDGTSISTRIVTGAPMVTTPLLPEKNVGSLRGGR
eukprot:331733-Chlamydomonas_euryale.AAC.2